MRLAEWRNEAQPANVAAPAVASVVSAVRRESLDWRFI